MVAKKRKSKRMTLKMKYRIQKKVKDHHKKLKKEQKKHPEKFRKRTKDPGVPKSLPFFEKILDEAETFKKIKDERKQEAKRLRREGRDKILEKKRDMHDMLDLLDTVGERAEEFEGRKVIGYVGDRLKDKSSKAYYREFKRVVEAADVVLEVLDARDPLGTRVPQLEATIVSNPGKKLVLVLNKADLVPRDILEKWLKYLRREHPTIVFKSSTQTQTGQLCQSTGRLLKMPKCVMQSGKCLGASVLMQLLKNYCRNKDIKTSICVGVVGLPNVGKSSLINSLKRSKSCGVGATPGFTKLMKEIHLDSNIKLLDCPGIVLPGKTTDNATAALRNAVKIEKLDDPITPVEAIFERASKAQLMLFYKLPKFDKVEDFLALLAKRVGKLKKKGIPDRNSAARTVLKDWNTGKIKYYTQPPEVSDTQVGASLVSELGKEFDLNSVTSQESSMLIALPKFRPSDTMMVESLGPVNQIDYMDESEQEESMDEDENDENLKDLVEQSALSKNVCINMDPVPETEDSAGEKKPRWETPLKEFDPQNMNLSKFQNKLRKKARKERNRNVRRTDELADALEKFTGLNEKESGNYDFDQYF